MGDLRAWRGIGWTSRVVCSGSRSLSPAGAERGSTRAGFEAAVEAARLAAPFRFHDCRHHFASWFMTRGWILARPAEEHLRGEMVKTERSAGVEPNAGTRVGESGQNASEVVEFTDERRGSSVAEQLIRNQ